MRLTTFSDYALRVLMYAASHKDRLITIEETAEFYNISRGHLMKVVNILTRAGFVRGVRGRSGGFMLARPPGEIELGAVVRATEPDFALVECFGRDNKCVISRDCRLPNILNEALSAFVSVFDRYTLADLPLAVRNFVPPDDISQVLRGPKIEWNSNQTEREER
ncbi:RrF2 family transcriptional regulator [Ciceribacter azotifigens]|uniref:RrF2 family transcriptional regulator n=1 Tax=Ciceribacter azotifigens TaxID=2069303 RepID=UPI003A844575